MAASRATPSGAPVARAGTAARSTRSSGWTGSSTRSSPRSGSTGPARRPSCRSTSSRSSARPVDSIRPARPPAHGRASRAGVRLFALADPRRLRQILEHLVENAVKYAPPDTHDHARLRTGRGRRPHRRRRRGPGHPRGVARPDLRALRAARHAHRAWLGHRAVRGEAARRIDGRPPVVRARRAGRRELRRSPCPPRRPSEASEAGDRRRRARCASSSSTTTRRWSARSPRWSAPRATRSSRPTTG